MVAAIEGGPFGRDATDALADGNGRVFQAMRARNFRHPRTPTPSATIATPASKPFFMVAESPARSRSETGRVRGSHRLGQARHELIQRRLLFDERSRRPADTASLLGIREQPFDCAPERWGVAGRYVDAGDAVDDRVRLAVCPGRDHALSHRHHFENGGD